MQFDQSLLGHLWSAKGPRLCLDIEDSDDQNAQIHRLIWAFAGPTSSKEQLFTWRFISVVKMKFTQHAGDS